MWGAILMKGLDDSLLEVEANNGRPPKTVENNQSLGASLR
jgi:hypothetical protein